MKGIHTVHTQTSNSESVKDSETRPGLTAAAFVNRPSGFSVGYKRLSVGRWRTERRAQRHHWKSLSWRRNICITAAQSVTDLRQAVCVHQMNEKYKEWSFRDDYKSDLYDSDSQLLWYQGVQPPCEDKPRPKYKK